MGPAESGPAAANHGGLGMASEQKAKQAEEQVVGKSAKISRKRQDFLARAGQAFDRMFGADGQNGLVTFAQREDRACEVGDELTRWLMAEHISLDPAGEASVEVACPLCGGPARYESVERAELELREFQTRRGKVEYRRVAARCPRCRKVFFPPG